MLQALTENELRQILTQPRNALCKQYQRLLGAANTDFKVTQEALHEIASAACRRNAGARGLRSILEQLLRDAMYEVRAGLVLGCARLLWQERTANKCFLRDCRARSHRRRVCFWMRTV